MRHIERSVYRTLKQNFTSQEIFAIFSPSAAEIEWAKANTRSLTLCLLVNLKIFQYLGYFPAYNDIPSTIITHIRTAIGANETVPSTYTDLGTLYKHRQWVRDFLHVLPWDKNAFHIAIQRTEALARIMENSTDLINALIETLIKEYYELPGFSILERLVRRVKNLVNKRIFADMEAKCTLLDTLDGLLEHPDNSPRTIFNRLKENPPNSTFTHLKELIERFHWLKSIGDASNCLKDIPESKAHHFTAEAKALDASEMKDFIPSKRHALLICLLNHSQMQAADDLLTMFCKRITDIHNSGDNALENFKQKNKEKSARLFALTGKILQVVKKTKSSSVVGI
jgi:hypothetical protein